MRKIKVFFDRAKTMSLRRMFMMIKQIHNETGKNSLLLLTDMIYCALVYNVGYQDYRVFGFAEIKRKNRKTFLTMNKNLELTRRMNKESSRAVYKNKTLFMKKFDSYIKRDWISLENGHPEALKEFCTDKTSIFVKTPSSFGGQGIGEIKINEYTNFDLLFEELILKGQTLIEEKINQHKKMSVLHPDSINTLRIVTLTKNERVHILSSLLRMGQNGSVIDNITSGGIYAPVSSEGVVTHPAFCDKTGESFTVHPTTKVYLIGFEIPYYKESIELITKIAAEEKEMGYVGWDVAISPDGPLIIEGNNLPTYEIMQNYIHRESDTGLLPEIEKILGEKL